ncbi:addiction module protein [candidate division KSB1 bacterium]|nr:addiction module protein [candidate division KSB1 bacterium]
MSTYENLLENALKLKPIDRAHLIEGLMTSMEKSDPEIEALWDQESLKRYNAYKQKRIEAKDLDEVLRKYE